MNRGLLVGGGVAVLGVIGYLLWGRGGLPKGARVLLVGDSLAEGLAQPLRVLIERAGYRFAASTARGSRIEQWTSKMDALLLSEEPKLVLVCLGTNDGAMSVPESEQASLDELVARVRRYGAAAVWITPPPMPPSLQGLDTVRVMIAKTGLRLVDSSTMQFERAPDRIHATPGGYAAWSMAIFSKLTPTPFRA